MCSSLVDGSKSKIKHKAFPSKWPSVSAVIVRTCQNLLKNKTCINVWLGPGEYTVCLSCHSQGCLKE